MGVAYSRIYYQGDTGKRPGRTGSCCTNRPGRDPLPGVLRRRTNNNYRFAQGLCGIDGVAQVLAQEPRILNKNRIVILKTAIRNPIESFILRWSLIQFHFSGSRMIQVVTGALLLRRGICNLKDIEKNLVGDQLQQTLSLIFIVERVGGPYLRRLEPLLVSSNDKVRAEALRVIARCGGKAELLTVRPFLSSPNEQERKVAWDFYLKHRVPFGLSIVKEFLGSSIEDIRRCAWEYYLRYGSQENLEKVRPFLSVEHARGIRHRAFDFFVKHGGSANVEEMRQLLNTEDNVAIEWALRFLTVHGGVEHLAEVCPWLKARFVPVRNAAWGFYRAHCNVDNLSRVKPLLGAADWELMDKAWGLFAQKGGASQLSVVRMYLEDEDGLVRERAWGYYCKFGSKENFPEIYPLLDCGITFLEMAAWNFFRLHGKPEHLGQIKCFLESQDPAIVVLAQSFCAEFERSDSPALTQGASLQVDSARVVNGSQRDVQAGTMLDMNGNPASVSASSDAARCLALMMRLDLALQMGALEYDEPKEGINWTVCGNAEPSFKKAVRSGQLIVVNGGFIIKIIPGAESTALYLGAQENWLFGGIYQCESVVQHKLLAGNQRKVAVPQVRWKFLRMSDLSFNELFAMVLDLRFNQ